MTTTAHPDPRLANLVSFGSVGLGAKYVGPLVPSLDAPLNVATRSTGAAVTKFLGIASEARTAAGVLPSARAAAVAEAAAPVTKKVTESAVEFMRLAPELDHDLRTATVVPPYGAAGAPLPDVLTDVELAKRHFSMDAKDKAVLIGTLKADPAANMTWLRSLLRSSPELSGLDAEQQTALRWAGLRALDPDAVTVLQARATQRDHAQQALHLAMSILREHAPAAASEAFMNADVQAALAYAGESIPTER